MSVLNLGVNLCLYRRSGEFALDSSYLAATYLIKVLFLDFKPDFGLNGLTGGKGELSTCDVYPDYRLIVVADIPG